MLRGSSETHFQAPLTVLGWNGNMGGRWESRFATVAIRLQYGVKSCFA